MKRLLLIVGIAIVAAGLLFILTLKKAESKDVIAEIQRIEALAHDDSLSVKDLSELKEMSKDNALLMDYFEEIEWVVKKGKVDHIEHSTSFMKEYLREGKDTPCLPHELWHIGIFIKERDVEFANKRIQTIDRKHQTWIESIDRKAQAYPQFFKNINQTKAEAKEMVEQLKIGNFSEQNLELMAEIGEKAPC